MNVPDERLAELAEIFRRTEAAAIDAGVITFEEAVEAALPAVLERHSSMIADEVRDYARRRHDSLDGATYSAYREIADRLERGAL